MIARDKRDSERTAAPLKPAEDAVIFDTSEMNAAEVAAKVTALIEEKSQKSDFERQKKVTFRVKFDADNTDCA